MLGLQQGFLAFLHVCQNKYYTAAVCTAAIFSLLVGQWCGTVVIACASWLFTCGIISPKQQRHDQVVPQRSSVWSQGFPHTVHCMCMSYAAFQGSPYSRVTVPAACLARPIPCCRPSSWQSHHRSAHGSPWAEQEQAQATSRSASAPQRKPSTAAKGQQKSAQLQQQQQQQGRLRLQPPGRHLWHSQLCMRLCSCCWCAACNLWRLDSVGYARSGCCLPTLQTCPRYYLSHSFNFGTAAVFDSDCSPTSAVV